MSRTLKALLASAVLAGLPPAATAAKIMDNSFLLEEAYNQEDGVIQHISSFQNFRQAKKWVYTFTQEWPVPSQKHQLSYTVPVNHANGITAGGDSALNYRYQLIFKDGLALAPRASLLLPTGNYEKSYGAGSAGLQVNLPLSVDLSEKWVTHWNWGYTYTPAQRSPSNGAQAETLGTNAGMSLIWLLHPNFNLMLENAWNSGQTVNPDGSKPRAETFYLSPGARGAINFKSGLQIVPGVAVPLGLGASGEETAVLGYLSFEHPLW
jgi:hypothetical protein